MASFTSLGDSVALSVRKRDERVKVDISGTYSMVIELQRGRAGGTLAWETIKTYRTANATVVDYYQTVRDRENIRLVVVEDTSGTATATLTEVSDKILNQVKNDKGQDQLTFKQSGVLADGVYLPRVPVSLTAATTLTAEDHAGRLLALNNATGFASTLPAATGSGNVYKFMVGTSVSSGTMSIDAVGSDKMAGVSVAVDATVFTNAGTAVSIDMNGTTTGGLKGTTVTFTDAASALWSVEMFQASSDAEATPFATS